MRLSDKLNIRDASQGLLHQLGLLDIHEEPPSEDPPREQAAREQQPRDPPPSYQETMEAPHVMISYKWDQQEKAVKVCKKLKEKGYNVWMDIEKLGIVWIYFSTVGIGLLVAYI